MIYRGATKALNGTGFDLDVAVTQFTQAKKVLSDVTVIEVASVCKARKEPPIKRKLVSEVARELLAVKRDKGRSFLYLKDFRLKLDRVAKVTRAIFLKRAAVTE